MGGVGERHDDTEELTAALAAGDEDAVERFYRLYFDWLYEQARRFTGGRDESFCLDVVQDALLRVIRTIRKVECERRLRAWLRLVVQTAACDKLRAEKRRVHHELAAAVIRETVTCGERDDPEEELEWLKSEIAKLDPQIVEMIECRYQRRWTLNRISQMLGLSIGTIDGRIRRALRELRQRAIEEFDD
jgi:RNA polymerase sigma-70 factor (ECF subfamily)